MPPKRKTKGPSGDEPKAKKAAKGQTQKKVAKPAKGKAKSPEPVPQAKASSSKVKAGSFDLKSLLKDPGWSGALKDELNQAYITQMEAMLAKDYAQKEIFPPTEKIFNAFNLTPLDKVKVVILGQDPYHDNGQAEGLAFSVPDGIAVPPSLKNIYKELCNDIPGFKTPSSGSLVKWAKEGVLLLNATLTVEAHTPNSHKSYGWQKLTDKVIKIISDSCPFVVFILWGNFAHKKEKLIDTAKHHLIKDAHPSPLSFNKFTGSKGFSKTNAALKKAGLKGVDWCL